MLMNFYSLILYVLTFAWINFVVEYQSWQFALLCRQFVKVEGINFESSFMSERASLFLSSIGLLGEYCPTSRKKEGICMHIEVNTKKFGCHFMRPIPSARKQSGKGFLTTIGNTSI
ncbi:hypothetical protein J1N35_035589 [Gossypium stocksii]|uniref:Uncharacterized protein n=1 Tax=Gossypium stocksii TaxID=47602 RepID=A0A9D3UUZ5_9ROSI|nr:hypothetical protein J1N35_035589 [Gossypium stocksii]